MNFSLWETPKTGFVASRPINVTQLYLEDFESQFRTTGGSQERNIATSVNINVITDATNISNSALLGLSFIFFVSKPPAKLPMQREISPVTAEKEQKHI